MRRDTFLKTMAALAAAGLLPLPANAAGSVKMMIPANPGGGWDTTGRALGKALLDAKAADNVTYDNKGGAAGALGLAQFVNGSKGDPNAMMVMGAVMLGGIITGKPPVNLSTCTPIARLTSEYNVFVLPASSPMKTMADVVAQLKKDPGSVELRGSVRAAGDQQRALFGTCHGEVQALFQRREGEPGLGGTEYAGDADRSGRGIGDAQGGLHVALQLADHLGERDVLEHEPALLPGERLARVDPADLGEVVLAVVAHGIADAELARGTGADQLPLILNTDSGPTSLPKPPQPSPSVAPISRIAPDLSQSPLTPAGGEGAE